MTINNLISNSIFLWYLLFVPASVRQIEWFDEEREFAIGFTDGIVKLGRKNPNFQPVSISAHQVSTRRDINECSCTILQLSMIRVRQ